MKRGIFCKVRGGLRRSETRTRLALLIVVLVSAAIEPAAQPLSQRAAQPLSQRAALALLMPHDGASFNTGAAFGLLSDSPSLALALSALGLAVVLWAALFCRWLPFLSRAGLAVASGGALSNLAERITLGGVMDWIPLPFSEFFISGGLNFNLADIEIAVGICLAAVLLLRKRCVEARRKDLCD